MRRIDLLVAAAVTLAIAACGGAGSQDKSSARGSTGTPASALQSRIPELLEGTWQTTIDSSRVVDAPDDLTEQIHTGRARPARVAGTEDGAQITKAGCGQQRVTRGVRGDVAVGMAGQPITLAGPFQARHPEWAARRERVDVGSDTHPWKLPVHVCSGP